MRSTCVLRISLSRIIALARVQLWKLRDERLRYVRILAAALGVANCYAQSFAMRDTALKFPDAMNRVRVRYFDDAISFRFSEDLIFYR